MPWDLCRICLYGNVKLHSITNPQHIQIYEKITDNQWNRENRPDTICYICLSQLEKCFKLIEMSQISEEILAQSFDNGIEYEEEMLQMLSQRRLNKFFASPVKTFSISFKSNQCIGDDEEGPTIKLENDPDIIIEDISSLENREVTSNIARTSSQTEVIENGTIQHGTPKAMKQYTHKKDTFKHNPTKKDVGKNSLKNNEIKSPKDKTLNKVSENNLNKHEKRRLSERNAKKNQKDQIELDNSLSGNISGICFTLRYEKPKTLQTHTGNKPDSLCTPNGVFSLLDQSPNKKKLVRMAYTCDYCQESFKFKHRFEEHISIHEEKLYFCKYCNSSFNQQHLLELHKESHSQRYACEECPKKFHRSFHLKQHLRTHRNKKSYHCEHCEKSFRQISNLQQHLRTHTGEKPYICHTCDKSFKQKSNLLQHNRVHTKEKPYICQICFKTFRQQSNLVQHRRIHEGEKPFGCEYCDKSFRQKSNLIHHNKKRHST